MAADSFRSIGAEAGLIGGDLEVGDAEPMALGAHASDHQQRLGRFGQRAVPVLPFDPDVVDLGVGGDPGEAAVRLEPELLLGDVVDRQERVRRHVELDLGRRL